MARRALVLLRRAGLAHAPLERPLELAVVPLEEQPCVVDRRAILGRGRLAGARRETLIEVVVQARTPLAVERLAAGRDLEVALHQLHRAAGGRGGKERAHVHVPVEPCTAHERDARIRIADRQLQVREVLVVTQHDVERGPLALDQVRLEDQRLHLGIDDDHLEVGHLADHPGDPGVVPGRVAEVRAHARAQRLRLADVDRLPGGVAIQVHARPAGQPIDLGREPVRHASILAAHGPGPRLDVRPVRRGAHALRARRRVARGARRVLVRLSGCPQRPVAHGHGMRDRARAAAARDPRSPRCSSTTVRCCASRPPRAGSPWIVPGGPSSPWRAARCASDCMARST